MTISYNGKENLLSRLRDFGMLSNDCSIGPFDSGRRTISEC